MVSLGAHGTCPLASSHRESVAKLDHAKPRVHKPDCPWTPPTVGEGFYARAGRLSRRDRPMTAVCRGHGQSVRMMAEPGPNHGGRGRIRARNPAVVQAAALLRLRRSLHSWRGSGCARRRHRDHDRRVGGLMHRLGDARGFRTEQNAHRLAETISPKLFRSARREQARVRRWFPARRRKAFQST